MTALLQVILFYLFRRACLFATCLPECAHDESVATAAAVLACPLANDAAVCTGQTATHVVDGALPQLL